MTEDLARRVDRLLAAYPPHETDPRAFLSAQYDAGLAWVWRTAELGGCEAPRDQQALVDTRLREAGAPNPFATNPIGFGMAEPTLSAYATEDDLRRLLRPLFTGEELWCQMFSEPSAGSDVAALGTRAVLDGDDWVVDGQKVWTSVAHAARWGLLLTRTDPSAPKHAGLTYFFVDMRSPGIEVRPLRQATGDADFNEVYLTGARVPDAQRLGAVGEGWKVALTTLMNERVSLGGQVAPRNSAAIGAAIGLWRDGGRDERYRDRLMQLWVRAEALRLTSERARDRALRGAPAGPEGSIGKLVSAELNQDVLAFCVDLLGAEGMLHPATYDAPAWHETGDRPDVRYWFLRSMANTIEGGTSEIMRNILGERLLGLPAPPRVDKDQPWNQLPR